MIKVFTNRKLRRLGATLLLGVYLASFSGVSISRATASEVGTPPAARVEPVTQDSADTSQQVSSGITSGEVQDAAQSGAQAALESNIDNISNQVADQLSGGTGVTWGDIYSSVNSVDSAVKTLDAYIKKKTVVKKDYYATVVGMYLSQYTSTMQGNLLNVVQGLEENLTSEQLETGLLINNTENAITLKEALDYIKSSYCVTPIYKGNEEQKIGSAASLRDMYEKGESSLYIKDTILKIEDFEVTNTKGETASISKVSGGTEGYIPALSYSARNSDAFNIVNMSLKEEDKAYCVFNSSSACRLALQFCYSELERYCEYEANSFMWHENNTLLDQGLYLDNFGNIVALDTINKQYTIVLNCMLNPTICAIGADEKFNMTAYTVEQVYTSHRQSEEVGLNYDSGSDGFEYSFSLGSSADKKIKSDGNIKYLGTKWVSNLLGTVPCEKPTSGQGGYFAVFSFTDSKTAKEESTKGPYKDVNKRPNALKIAENKTYGSSEMDNRGYMSGKELTPASGYEPAVTGGSEDGEAMKSYRASKGISLAYIKTNHNRAQEAYYGYKNLTWSREGLKTYVEQTGKDAIVNAASAKDTILNFGYSKASSSVRGEMGGYTIMPVKTNTLFYGVGDKFLSKASETKWKYRDQLTDKDVELKYDLYGYYQDYCSFYSTSLGNLTRYVGYLYTPKWKRPARGTVDYMLEQGTSISIKNIDADTIFYNLQFMCKTGILRKANITNVGRKQNGEQKAKGLKGYQQATTKLIEEANSKIKDYIATGFELSNDSPVQGIKYKDIWAIGVDIYGGETDLLEQSKRTVVVHDNVLGKNHTLADYDTVWFFMGVAKNTSSSTVSVTSAGELSEEAKQSLKEEKATNILDRVLEMLTNPITTFVKLVSGFLQWIHTGLSNGRLVSFFYVTNEDVDTWLGKLPMIMLMITVVVFTFRMALGSLKFFFSKDYKFKHLLKDFAISAALITIPVITLSGMRTGIALISDKGMNDSTVKIESVYLNKQLVGSIQSEVASATAKNESAKYFIEHFSPDRTAEVSIDVLATSQKIKNKTVNPNDGRTSKFVYESFDVSKVPSLLIEAASKGAEAESGSKDEKYGLCYSGKKFDCVLHEHYSKSVFFYFLDYYINEWCLLNGKTGYYSSSNPQWGTTLCREMVTSKSSFRNLYSKRAVVYGPSAGIIADKKCIDDIFGLGQLFYHDGKSVSGRSYYLPIEVFDNRMVLGENQTDKTRFNSNNDLWNSFKHGSYFVDSNFSAKQQILESDTENDEMLGKSEYNMAYGFEALVNRREKCKIKDESGNPSTIFKKQVIASEAVFVANKIPVKYATKLEKALWDVNNNIYIDVIDYFNQDVGEVNDLTDAIMLASICTFKFNEKFGKSFSVNDAISFTPENSYLFKFTEITKPTSFSKEELDMDVILKAVYSGNHEVKEEYDLMYYLGNNAYGVTAALILIVAEVFMVVYLIIRMLHLIVVYILTTVVCTYQYSLKRDNRSKAWLGVLAQALYFFLAHLVQIFMLNMAVCNDMPKGDFTSILLSLLVLLGSFLGVTIEITVMIFLLKNFKDLGGQIVADKVQSAMADIKGKFSGDMKSDSVKLDADKVVSYGNDDDEELKESNAGGSELAEDVEHANRVREGNKSSGAGSSGGSGGSGGDGAGSGGDSIELAGGTGADGNPYMNIESSDVSSSVTGGDSFGELNFETASSMNSVSSSEMSSTEMSFSSSEMSSVSSSEMSFSSNEMNSINSSDYESGGISSYTVNNSELNYSSSSNNSNSVSNSASSVSNMSSYNEESSFVSSRSDLSYSQANMNSLSSMSSNVSSHSLNEYKGITSSHSSINNSADTFVTNNLNSNSTYNSIDNSVVDNSNPETISNYVVNDFKE